MQGRDIVDVAYGPAQRKVLVRRISCSESGRNVLQPFRNQLGELGIPREADPLARRLHELDANDLHHGLHGRL